MNKIKIYVLLACLWAVSALQAQNFGSEAMRKLQMAEFAISHFYVDKEDEDKLATPIPTPSFPPWPMLRCETPWATGNSFLRVSGIFLTRRG